VRLVGRVQLRSAYRPDEFQFQIGAIGRILLCDQAHIAKRFQFQIGAIGSRYPLCYDFKSRSFNSRLVRLVAIAIIAGAALIACFNSRLVRLVVRPLPFVTFIIPVSIPDWCDW